MKQNNQLWLFPRPGKRTSKQKSPVGNYGLFPRSSSSRLTLLTFNHLLDSPLLTNALEFSILFEALLGACLIIPFLWVSPWRPNNLSFRSPDVMEDCFHTTYPLLLLVMTWTKLKLSQSFSQEPNYSTVLLHHSRPSVVQVLTSKWRAGRGSFII